VHRIAVRIAAEERANSQQHGLPTQEDSERRARPGQLGLTQDSESGSAKTPICPEADDRDQYGLPKAEEQAHRSIGQRADKGKWRDVIGMSTVSRTRTAAAAEVSDDLGQRQGLKQTYIRELVV
jgi:hypothetical protein